VPRPRPPRLQPYPQPPRDPIREALNGKLDAEEWEELRAAAWEAWLELVTVEAEQKTADHRDPARGPISDWPPRGAQLHDGLEDRALARWFDERSAIGPERQRAWAEEGLAELASFRERNPEGAEANRGGARRIREPAARDPCRAAASLAQAGTASRRPVGGF
jgi:hypothetical protein